VDEILQYDHSNESLSEQSFTKTYDGRSSFMCCLSLILLIIFNFFLLMMI